MLKEDNWSWRLETGDSVSKRSGVFHWIGRRADCVRRFPLWVFACKSGAGWDSCGAQVGSGEAVHQ